MKVLLLDLDGTLIDTSSIDHLESIVWPDGPTCPHCGAVDRINKLKGVEDKKSRVRIGLWKCYHCRKQFTVRVGTLFERSHVPLYKWFQACYLMCSSKKGVSSHQLHRTLEVTYKTAWFMAHRIRMAMKDFSPPQLGGKGKYVEADETYFGGKRKFKKFIDKAKELECDEDEKAFDRKLKKVAKKQPGSKS